MCGAKSLRRIAGVAGAATLLSAAVLTGAAGDAGAALHPGAGARDTTAPTSAPGTIVVSPTGADSASCGSASAPCLTINQGLTNAPAGGTVLVTAGIYKQQVVVTKAVHLVGNHAVINAAGMSSGSGTSMNAAALLVAATASGTSIEGFAVHGAIGEGILVMGASRVTVAHNDVSGNDLGTPTTTTYLECQAQGEVPGDCGEGIHLMSATASTIAANRVENNAGGILVTDEIGPASDNTIVGNFVADNLYDCGITLPSHSASAVASDGTRQPTKGGVFDNVVESNVVLGNGVLGDGAGILIAAAAAGGAAYDNLIADNLIDGNGMAGVTIHAHATPQDVSGNVIRHNLIGVNNLAGDPDANVQATTGIIVASSGPAVTVTLQHNVIAGNSQAVFTTANVTVTS